MFEDCIQHFLLHSFVRLSGGIRHFISLFFLVSEPLLLMSFTDRTLQKIWQEDELDCAELKAEDNSESDNMEQSSLNETELEKRSHSLEGKEEKDCELRHVRKKRKLLDKEDAMEIEGEGGLEVACVSSGEVQSISSEDSQTSTELLLEKFYRMSRSSKDQNVPNQPIPLDLPDPSEGFLAQCFPGKIWSNSVGPL